MAKLLGGNKTAFLSLLFCLLILAAFEAQVGEAACERPSKGYHKNNCFNRDCSSYCQNYNRGYGGYCKQYWGGYYCFCYYRGC